MSTRCAVHGCDQTGRRRSWCDAHYNRWIRNGDPGPAARRLRRPGATCAHDGCDGSLRHGGRGYHPRWTGDEASYSAMHRRIRATRGRAADHQCTGCAKQAADWAYDHDDSDEGSSPDGPYSIDPEHYRPMCRSCHKTFDIAKAAASAC